MVRTKQQVIDETCLACGIGPFAVSRGSSEPKEFLSEVAKRIGLDLPPTLSKPDLAQAIVEASGEKWQPTYDSRLSPSGGGSTVTIAGLEAVLRAVRGMVGAKAQVTEAPELGLEYRAADESIKTAERDPIRVDPDKIDRANISHRHMQNALAAWAKARGFKPISPSPSTPNWDVAWQAAGELVVCEVKSLSDSNEDTQVRLGLGQVLDYAHTLRQSGRSVRPVLALAKKPTSARWEGLCASVHVLLVWPDALDRLDN